MMQRHSAFPAAVNSPPPKTDGTTVLGQADNAAFDKASEKQSWAERRKNKKPRWISPAGLF
jgi:hypothetical protein